MARIVVRDVSVAFGVRPVLDHVDLRLEEGERVGLLGRNGEGKSTLLALIAGHLSPDTGNVDRAPSTRVALLPQNVPSDLSGSVRSVVAEGLVEAEGAELGWHRVDKVLSWLEMPADTEVATLSAGMRRRALLARALVSEPDVLLLDEPTNHLDVATMAWLEQRLVQMRSCLLFVTHDRAFLQRLATRIVELDRGRLRDWRCSYGRYLQRKQQSLDEEAVEHAVIEKKIAQEEAWARRSPKARRRRNEGRVRALERLRQARAAWRKRVGAVELTVQEAERSGKLVIEAGSVSFSYGEEPVIRSLSTVVLRGDRVGIMGPNNCGKTTLLRLLLGELAPSGGRVRLGSRLQVAYFDQLRALLDETKSVADNVADGAELLPIGGQQRHVLGYLQDFLFSAERARSPLASLSGGERTRLLLAKLFLTPSNLLVLDEPTNDLDLETIELLEDRLADYDGTVLVVSHDRTLLDNVVSSTLVFEGDGVVREYAGGYSDWLSQRQAERAEREATERSAAGAARDGGGRAPKGKLRTSGPRKLGFMERRELESLPGRIEQLEEQQRQIETRLGDPSLYQQSGGEVGPLREQLAALEEQIAAAYDRWQQLQSIADEQA